MIPLVRNISKVVKFIETKHRMWLPGAKRKEEMGSCVFNEYRLSVLQEEKVLDICCTKMC